MNMNGYLAEANKKEAEERREEFRIKLINPSLKNCIKRDIIKVSKILQSVDYSNFRRNRIIG